MVVDDVRRLEFLASEKEVEEMERKVKEAVKAQEGAAVQRDITVEEQIEQVKREGGLGKGFDPRAQAGLAEYIQRIEELDTDEE